MPSLLQGVSQQIPRERQPGQVGAQVNMTSDPVTGIRRRPPAHYVATSSMTAPEQGFLFTAYIERGTDGRHLLINTNTGFWQLLSKDTGSVLNSGTSPYLVTSIGATSIQTASVAGLTYILNTEKTPVVNIDNTGKLDPSTTGFFYATAVAFSKLWSVTISSTSGTWSASYDSPSASASDAATNSATSYVIQQLYAKLIAAGMSAANLSIFGNFLYVHGLSNVVVTSDAGKSYAVWSNQSRVDQESDLPGSLPAVADGTMCRVGQAGSDMTWYRFNYAARQWVEDGAYGSVTSITNMPLELAADDNIIARTFEGRLAGDDDTNEDPAFVSNGYITGIAAFQGRLILLSGSSVCMSASGLYQRFYRSTVTSLLDKDRIDIAAASAQDSIFRSALQFNRDLVVFGDSMQAVVPGAAALTPTNASISLTSEFSCDSRIRPIITGQTALYANRRNTEYAGILEFIPSSYTASQYVSQDATAHLPRYIPGRIIGMHVSSVTNVGFVRYSGNYKALLIYEFLWGTDSKRMQGAYHTWTFPVEILSMHAQSELVYLFVRGSTGQVVTLKIDPREGFVADAVYQLPLVDMGVPVTVSGGAFSLPSVLRYSGITVKDIALAYPETSSAAGDELGLSELGADYTVKTVRGVPDGAYVAGLKYKSLLTLTPPMMKDRNDNLVGSGHVRLLRLDVAVRSSGDFDILVTDSTRDVDESLTGAGVLMNSKELALGSAIRADLANIIVPCRTNSDTTDVTLSSDSTLEMNILDVTYILRYNQRRQRV